jgi:transposase
LGITDAPGPGAPAKATRSYREQLLAVVRRRPRALGLPFSLWTGDRLSDYLAERTGIRMSKPSVYRLLRAGGVHLNRPQHTITSPDPEYAVKKRRWSAPVPS